MECNFENCGYYTDGECNICGMGISGEDTFCKFCKDNPKCYYKQLQKLKAENDRLKEEIEEVKKYQYEQEYLEKEIETAKVNLDIGKEEARHYLHEAYKFQKCLQAIKAIVCGNYEIIDPQWRKDILKLITKAEEE